MNKSFKKLLSVLLVMVLTVSVSAFVVLGEDIVAINETNFPDEQFRAVVSEKFDYDEDGFLSPEERNVSYFQISGYVDDDVVIKDLKGIEFFASIRNLRCAALGLESLDVSALTNLTSLTCEGNALTSLDVSANTALTKLVCRDNQLTSLVLGTNPNLQEIYCETNNLTRLITSGLANLKYLSCYQNEITSLDVSANSELEDISCASNHLREIDLSNNRKLIQVTENQLEGQTITANAYTDGNAIYVNPQLIRSYTVSWTSLDYVDEASAEGAIVSGFQQGRFIAYDVADVDKVIDESLPEDMNVVDYGIDYRIGTGNSNCADMAVSIEVFRNFRQIDFYTSENMTTRIDRKFITVNNSCPLPEASLEAPRCKKFDSWSDELTCVTEDMNVYPLWADNHYYYAVAAFDDVYATLSCKNCISYITVKFIDYVNTQRGDENYYPGLDQTSDGYVNAKDFAVLHNSFKNIKH